MAHIITDAEAQTLTRIARAMIGPIVGQGLIWKRDREDAVRELLLAVVRNADNYNDASDAEFLTFAHGVMQNEAYRAVRKRCSATYRILSDAVSIDAWCEAEDTDDTPDYREIEMALQTSEVPTLQEDRRQSQILLVRSVINSLSPDMREICRLLIAGCNASEISRRTALSRKAVRIRIPRIKEALIEAGVIIRGKNNGKKIQNQGPICHPAWQ